MSGTYRWITYTQQHIPGSQSFELGRVASLAAARDAFATFCTEVMSDECSATLYAYSDDSWTSAEEFRDIGCPFDYPDRLIERGPRGGVVVRRA